jgi:hypothetical protein
MGNGGGIVFEDVTSMRNGGGNTGPAGCGRGRRIAGGGTDARHSLDTVGDGICGEAVD